MLVYAKAERTNEHPEYAKSCLMDWFWLKFDPHSARAAEVRWRDHNYSARAKGCEVCRKEPHFVYRSHDNVGSIPVEFWYCDKHRYDFNGVGTRVVWIGA